MSNPPSPTIPPSSEIRDPPPPSDGFPRALGDVGAAWAARGLRIGTLALEMSAKTLEGTAKMLAAIATELTKKETPRPSAGRPAGETR